jgi:MFS family permease
MRERPTLGRVALAQGFYGGGFIAAGPLFALVNVDRLNLSLFDVGIIGVLSAVATTVSFLIWGAVSDRVDVLAPMRFGSIIGLVGLFLYALAPSVYVLWLASIAIGTSGPSIEIGVAGVISAETPMATRAAAMSGWNAITGVRGLVAPFVMSALVQAGLLSVTVALLLCVAVSGLGVALFWWASRRARAEFSARAATVS